jgi:hypothetical protein
MRESLIVSGDEVALALAHLGRLERIETSAMVDPVAEANAVTSQPDLVIRV